MWYGSNLGPAVGNLDMRHAIKLPDRAMAFVGYETARPSLALLTDTEYALARPMW